MSSANTPRKLKKRKADSRKSYIDFGVLGKELVDSQGAYEKLAKIYDQLTNQKTLDIPTDLFISVNGDSNDTRRFEVHRFVVSLQSEMLNRMLYGQMSESKEKEVSLRFDDQKDATKLFDDFVRFCYTAKMNLDPEKVVTILGLCDYLQANALQKVCTSFMIKTIDEDTVFSYFNTAVRYHNKVIIQICAEYLVLNTPLLGAQHIYKLSRESMKILLENNEINVCEIDLFRCLVLWGKSLITSSTDDSTSSTGVSSADTPSTDVEMEQESKTEDSLDEDEDIPDLEPISPLSIARLKIGSKSGISSSSSHPSGPLSSPTLSMTVPSISSSGPFFTICDPSEPISTPSPPTSVPSASTTAPSCPMSGVSLTMSAPSFPMTGISFNSAPPTSVPSFPMTGISLTPTLPMSGPSSSRMSYSHYFPSSSPSNQMHLSNSAFFESLKLPAGYPKPDPVYPPSPPSSPIVTKDTTEIRNAIKDLISLIRFPLMTLRQLTHEVTPIGVVPNSLLVDAFCYLVKFQDRQFEARNLSMYSETRFEARDKVIARAVVRDHHHKVHAPVFDDKLWPLKQWKQRRIPNAYSYLRNGMKGYVVHKWPVGTFKDESGIIVLFRANGYYVPIREAGVTYLEK